MAVAKNCDGTAADWFKKNAGWCRGGNKRQSCRGAGDTAK